jgi:hypothetical protein
VSIAEKAWNNWCEACKRRLTIDQHIDRIDDEKEKDFVTKAFQLYMDDREQQDLGFYFTMEKLEKEWDMRHSPLWEALK